jgi:copper(I)-binding protein
MTPGALNPLGRRIGAAALVLVLLLAACAPPATSIGSLKIESPWSRAGVSGTNAVYLTIRNDGSTADRLIAASTPNARVIEIHQSTMEGGVARMGQVPGIDIPAGGSVELKPGGFHLMLIDAKPINAGERFPLTLRFERAGEGTIQVEARSS